MFWRGRHKLEPAALVSSPKNTPHGCTSLSKGEWQAGVRSPWISCSFFEVLQEGAQDSFQRIQEREPPRTREVVKKALTVTLLREATTSPVKVTPLLVTLVAHVLPFGGWSYAMRFSAVSGGPQSGSRGSRTAGVRAQVRTDLLKILCNGSGFVSRSLF